MLIGKIIRLVNLSTQSYSPNSRLVADRNEQGYGILEDAEGHEVYFAHDLLPGKYGFRDLRKGQRLEYTLESAPYLRAASVRAAPAGLVVA